MARNKLVTAGIFVFFAFSVVLLKQPAVRASWSGLFMLGLLFGVTLAVSGVEAWKAAKLMRAGRANQGFGTVSS